VLGAGCEAAPAAPRHATLAAFDRSRREVPAITTRHDRAAGVAFAELVAPLALPAIDPARWIALARGQFANRDVAMAYLALGRALGLGDRMRPFDLFLATGADFGVEHTLARIPWPGLDLAALVAAATV
jgi:hypothetical protein